MPRRLTAELVAPILIAGIALDVALTIFLSEYLLYRYDHDDAAALIFLVKYEDCLNRGLHGPGNVHRQLQGGVVLGLLQAHDGLPPDPHQLRQLPLGQALKILISGIALTVALTMFLSEYLLYRYDHDDTAALEEGE